MFAVFSRPMPVDTATSTMPDFLLAAFRSAAKSSRVRGAMFHWSDDDFTEQLDQIRSDRSLRLHIVAGDRGHNYSTAVRSFFRKLDKSFLGKVRPFGYKNHNKWFLFNSLDWNRLEAESGVLPVGAVPSSPSAALYVSSSNLSTGDRRKHNASVLIPVNSSIADAFKTRYGLLRAASWISLFDPIFFWFLLSPFASFFKTAENEDFRTYQYPRRPRVEDNDTIANILKRVEHHDRRSDEPCEIRMVTQRWRNSRLWVAKALHKIADNGGVIEFVGRGPHQSADLDGDDDNDPEPEMGALVASELALCATRYWQKDDPKANIHSKYLIVRAPYKQADGSFKLQEVVWTGSPTMSTSALSASWETLVKLKPHTGFYQAFLDDFEYLKQNATDPPVPIEPP